MLKMILILLMVAVLAFLYTVYLWYRTNEKLTYMLDSLDNDDVSFRFRERLFFDISLNRTLNRLREIYEKRRTELREQEQYFAHMLENVQTGIVVLEESGRVVFYNNYAKVLLGMGSLSNLRQLRRVNVSLFDAFSSVQPGISLKASYYNESSKVDIVMQASNATIKGREVKIVSFSNIDTQLSENQEESWNKLTRVLTHEIMNTITPIVSLSDTLNKCAVEDRLDSNYISGLETISASSKGLLSFVESYRSLTRVAAPIRKSFLVSELVERVFQLTAPYTEEASVKTSFVEKAPDILLWADENQIAQILINLVKNAVQAGATGVEISADLDSLENVVIEVSNNGTPISREGREEIFVPFYTTKQEGTGIGLSLSRQIMRLHNGTLTLSRSDSTATVFVLHFK
ncbi:MAG: HAMP domain-containing histidine kinase [Bacteroidales bacterium]|nr:HAMP domain-containing histidine kinase [Bacteroidales bacterium]